MRPVQYVIPPALKIRMQVLEPLHQLLDVGARDSGLVDYSGWLHVSGQALPGITIIAEASAPPDLVLQNGSDRVQIEYCAAFIAQPLAHQVNRY
jgi:hypothetical protein